VLLSRMSKSPKVLSRVRISKSRRLHSLFCVMDADEETTGDI